MVLVSADMFLAKVTELYEQSAAGSKGSVAISCKSGASMCVVCGIDPLVAATIMVCVTYTAVPVKKLAKAGSRDKALAAAEHALLFRVCKYGNNKHKKKYSTTVTVTQYYPCEQRCRSTNSTYE